MTLSHVVRAAMVGAVVLTLSACAATYRNHGYAPTDAELETLVVGVDTRASVEDSIGRPSTTGVLTQSAYYYLASRRRHFAFQEPKTIDRQLVAISFDADDIVANIERFTLEDGRVVPLSRRVTTSNVQDVTFLRQLLGNLGRFDPTQIIGGGETDL